MADAPSTVDRERDLLAGAALLRDEGSPASTYCAELLEIVAVAHRACRAIRDDGTEVTSALSRVWLKIREPGR